MEMDIFIYDISILGFVLISAGLITIFSYHAAEHCYWSYVDKRSGRK